MNKTLFLGLLIATLFCGCRSSSVTDTIVSMQTIDRNGFSETISNKDRLAIYQNVEYLSPQPYQKVLRVFGKDGQGKSPSKLTSYHDNGGVWQYLEAMDGRANGRYIEWHENGQKRIEGRVIEGLADLGDVAQKSWLFDGPCNTWDQAGNVTATFQYDRGLLVEDAIYYFPNGHVRKIIPHQQGEVHGVYILYNDVGVAVVEVPYKMGVRHGTAHGRWDGYVSKYQETWDEGLLIEAQYFDYEGNIVSKIDDGDGIQTLFDGEYVSKLTEYRHGKPEGEVRDYSQKGELQTRYFLVDGTKTGEEWHYYPSSSETPAPKMMLTWDNDRIQGMKKTWYRNGVLETQCEMSGNKKQGLSFAYYKNSDLMLMEEYDNGRLIRGSYYRKGDTEPSSKIENGKGIATLFNAEGYFFRKIDYDQGRPLVD